MPELLLLLTLLLNVTSDYLDRNSTRTWNPTAAAFWGAVFQFLLIAPLIGLVDRIDGATLAICLAVGLFSAVGRIPWYRALAMSQGSLARYSPFLRLSSVFVLALAAALLGEHISAAQWAGALLIILSALLVMFRGSTRAPGERDLAGPEVVLLLWFAVSTALISVSYKFLLERGVTIWTIYVLLKFVQALTLMATVSETEMGSVYSLIKNVRLFVMSRVLQTAAAIALLAALARMDLSRAEPLLALGPFLYLLADRWIERKHPEWIPRDPDKRGPPDQNALVISLALAAAGIFLFYYKP